MANTYTQLHIHLIFAVKGRKNLISSPYRSQIEKYISGVVQNRKHKMLAIYCMPDHIHLFLGLHPEDSISNLVVAIKKASKSFIKAQPWMFYPFEWQRGYGAFSYSRSQVGTVIQYILNQAKHHEKKSFKQEYLEILTQFEIEFNEKYVFEFYE